MRTYYYAVSKTDAEHGTSAPRRGKSARVMLAIFQHAQLCVRASEYK